MSENDAQRDANQSNQSSEPQQPSAAQRVSVTLTARQEKSLLRPTGSRRHAVFGVRAEREQPPQTDQPAEPTKPRRPLTLALTLDRSGSMSGAPLRMAKQVAITLMDGLTEQDELAVVIFDDKIETLQELTAVTPEVKRQTRRALEQIEARGSTALHEAWLTSCNMLAGDHLPEDRLARCYLLTDGQANVGETDVETIATQAAGVREHVGVGTSAFGLGDDYNEHLLGPWAVAGGGQFHDLRNLADLADTFLGERDELRAVVALRTRLEVEMAQGMSAEVISAYWRADSANSRALRWRLDIGDLIHGEERNVVVRFRFPKEDKAYAYTVRARAVWVDSYGEHSGPWQEIAYTYGSNDACDDEPRDLETMRAIGLAHADRTRRRALELAAHREPQDNERAQRLIEQTVARISDYAHDDPALLTAIRELQELAETIKEQRLTSRMSKATYFALQTRSRGQRDHRTTGGDDK
ncbi:MAG TPA: VWA domain-containing protein [Ktedonobacterales bacterium]|nr:VWA domain-containing protein [Ktedonobacterales bacterium]